MNRRRTWRRAALALTVALVLAGLAVAAGRYGDAVWSSLAPDTAREPTGATLTEPGRDASSGAARDLGPGDSAGRRTPPDAGTPRRAAPAVEADREQGTKPGVRHDVRRDAPTRPTAQDRDVAAADGGAPEPAFTVEVWRGRTTYRMDGVVVGDPDVAEHRDGPIEEGLGYRFGRYGLEKVPLWEVQP